jgi:hypothetical protein
VRPEQEPAQADVFLLSSVTCDMSLPSTTACLTDVRSIAGRFASTRSLPVVLK